MLWWGIGMREAFRKLLQNLQKACLKTILIIKVFPRGGKCVEVEPLINITLNQWIALAGLTCAMYMKDNVKVQNPDPQSGLYISDRSGSVVKVGLLKCLTYLEWYFDYLDHIFFNSVWGRLKYESSCETIWTVIWQAVFAEGDIAYQMGEATEILTGGILQATLHSVQVFVRDARICKRWCTSCHDSAIHILIRHLKPSLCHTLLFTGSLWWECNWSGTQHLCSIHAASLVRINRLNSLLWLFGYSGTF